MDRHQELLAEVAALTKGRPHQSRGLALPDLLALVERGNVVLPVSPLHLGVLWTLDRCGAADDRRRRMPKPLPLPLPLHPPPNTAPLSCHAGAAPGA